MTWRRRWAPYIKAIILKVGTDDPKKLRQALRDEYDRIDGTPRPVSRFLQINLRVTRNTLEQAFLAVITWLGLAMTLPAERLTLIPVLAILFAAGRLAFWIGYQVSPAARAFGFGLTALPTAIALIVLAWQILFA